MLTSKSISHIELTPMPQLVEAIDREDDWTGVTDAASRRKRQNRLNVRAYRRRKALGSKINSASASEPGKYEATAEPKIPCWVEAQQTIFALPASVAGTLANNKTPLIPYYSKSTTQSLPPAKIVFPLSADHLMTLLQFNVLRACITNRALLTAAFPSSPESDPPCTTTALSVLPFPSIPSSLPPSLHPTLLQRTVPHEAWIDIIPHPVWRDNLLLAIGTFDEDQLWSDTIGGLFEGFPHSEVERRGVVVWDKPWDVSGWEVSEGFWQRWKWSSKGCGDVFEATNRWRALRGEEPLCFEVEE